MGLAKTALMTAALAIPALVFTGITFYPSHVPDAFIEGVGLTSVQGILRVSDRLHTVPRYGCILEADESVGRQVAHILCGRFHSLHF